MSPARHVAFVSLGALVLASGGVALYGLEARAQSSPPLLADATDAPAPYAAFLRAIPVATTVRIRDGWMGLSPLAPVDHHYEFHRVGSEFRGSGVCSVRRQEHPLADVSFPVATVTAVLARLAHVPVSRGPYTPLITHTDDYPTATIELETPGGTVTFTTRSQGRFAPPWQITLATGATGVVSSSVPGEALSAFLAQVGANLCGDWTRTLRPR